MFVIEPFRVVEILSRAQQLQQQGRSIIHLEAGEPDFEVAQPVVKAAQQALELSHTGYTEGGGIWPLRHKLSEYYQRYWHLEVPPECILITAGGSAALVLLLMLLVGQGDKVLLSDPGYPCYRNLIGQIGGIARLVGVEAKQNYQLNDVALAENWDEQTVGTIVASPANPTGAVLSLSKLQALWKVTSARGGWLIADETYHGLSYDAPAASILSVTDAAYVIGSFSKFFGMTGFRIGWLVAPQKQVMELEKMAQNLFISPPTVSQHAALAALESGNLSIFEKRREILRQRRDYLLGELMALGFDVPLVPAGAMYIYAGAGKFSEDSERFCSELLEQHGLAVVPGLDFGRYRAAEHLRFSYTTTISQLQEAVRRLKRVCSANI